MLLSELLSADLVKIPLDGRTKADVLRELVGLVVATHPGLDADAVLASVLQREAELSTGIGGGVAVPHGRTPLVDDLLIAAGVSAAPVEYEALDAAPVRLFFLLVSPESAAGLHVKALSRISRVLRRDALRERLLASASVAAFLAIVSEAEAA
ncbi:MAG: PTS sugar transporter subunit IIA [Gemmatimonadaceae bacterium]